MAEIRNTYNSWNEVEKEIAEGGGGGGYTPGNGIDISGGSISAKVDGTTVQFDSNGRLKAVAGPGGVTKEYVDTQDAALQTQINNKQDKITDTVATAGLTDADYMSDLSGTSNKRFILTKLWDYIKSKITGAISTAIEGDFIASRALVTNASGKLIESQTSATELGYVKGVTSDIQDQLDDKQAKLTDSDETSSLSDTSKFSLVDSSAKTNKKWALSSLWTYIKGKITSVYYPVGTVIFNTGTNPSTNFGGTWSLYATGTKALYLDGTAGTTVNEELPNPSITIGSNGKKTVDFKGTKGFKYKSGGQANSWGMDYGTHELYEQATFDSVETASNHSHTVTVGNSVYKSSGKVRAEGITICAWKRTA